MTPSPAEVDKAVEWYSGGQRIDMHNETWKHGKVLALALRQSREDRDEERKRRQGQDDILQSFEAKLEAAEKECIEQARQAETNFQKAWETAAKLTEAGAKIKSMEKVIEAAREYWAQTRPLMPPSPPMTHSPEEAMIRFVEVLSRGWECPKCGTVNNPNMPSCFGCVTRFPAASKSVGDACHCNSGDAAIGHDDDCPNKTAAHGLPRL